MTTYRASLGCAPATPADLCTWPAAPSFTPRANLRYVSNGGSDSNPGSLAAPWRSIDGPRLAGQIPSNTEIQVLGASYSPPSASLIDTSGNAGPFPNALTIRPAGAARSTTLDGQGSRGNAFQFWYPPSVWSDIEVWGFNIANWRLPTLGGGTAPITAAGDISGLRIIRNKFSGNGAANGSLDHTLYLAGGLTYATALRNLVVQHNQFDEQQNAGSLIKLGSGGPGTAGPNGGGAVGSNTHDASFRYNIFNSKGWGWFDVLADFTPGTAANTTIEDNIAIVDSTNLREYNGAPFTGGYAGPLYFDFNYVPGLVGADSSFLVRNNQLQVTAQDQADWNVIYANAGLHNPTVVTNRLSNLANAAKLIKNIPMGSNVAGTPDFTCFNSRST